MDIEISSIAQVLSEPRAASSVVAFERQSCITWAEFQSDVGYYSEMLNQHQAKRVALCFGDSYLFAVAFFAACYAQKALVLPGNYQSEAVRELHQHFDLILHDRELSTAASLDALLISKQSETPALNANYPESSALRSEPWPAFSLEQIALTLFTSGSSGQAKAITKTLQQLDSEIAILESLWGKQIQAARIESTVSHQHIYGLLFRLLWPLCAGRPFASHNLEFPEQVIQHANLDTVLVSSPALLKRLADESTSSALRAVFSSGGPLPFIAAENSERLFGQRPIEVFGSTETGGIAHRQQLLASSAWRLFPGVEAMLNHEQCLRLRAQHIDGDNWYQTADQCEFHDQHRFELKGRTDRIVKVEEKRISLVEVEKRLEQLTWIAESAVIPISEDSRLSLCAAIVLTDEGEQELQRLGKGKFWISLRNKLRDWLEPIAIPRRYRLLNEIPMNSQSKRQVAEIEKLFQS